MPAPRSNAIKKKQQARAKRLREIWDRKKSQLGLVQKDVARKLGWQTQGAVGHLFSGSTPLTIDLLLAVCNILEVAPHQIVPELKELLKYDDRSHSSAASQIQDIDLGLLGTCIKTIEDAEREKNTALSKSTKSKLVEFLYAELAGSNKNRKAVKEMADRLLAIAESSL